MRKNQTRFNIEKVHRIAVVEINPGLGDLVLITPLLRELRRNLPNAWITLIVVDRFADIVQTCPYVDEVIPTPQFFNQLTWGWAFGYLREIAPRFWWRRIDLAIAIHPGACALAAFLTGASWRLGYSHKTNYDRFLNIEFSAVAKAHIVEKNTALLQHMGFTVDSDRLELWLTEADEEFARNFFEREQVKRIFVVALGIGASAQSKQWPRERFIDVSKWLMEKYEASIIVVGSVQDQAAADSLVMALGANAHNLAGKTTPRQAAAVLKCCNLYVGNDSGPKHLAAAGCTPVVEISQVPEGLGHANSPHQWHAWRVPTRVVQPPGGAGELICSTEAVTVKMVQDAISGMLNSRFADEVTCN